VIFTVRIIKMKKFSRPDRDRRPRSRPDFFSGSRPVVGRDRIFFLGRDPWPVATGFFFWVATRGRSRPDFFPGSRPVVGRDPPENSGRDLDRVEVPNTTLKERSILGTHGGRKGDGVRKNGDGTVTVTAQKR
jgi:hypothetical protein